MARYNNKSQNNSEQYEKYNIQGQLIQNIGESLFEIERKISRAYEERPSGFLDSLSSLRTFLDKILGMNLEVPGKDKDKILIYLQIAQKLFEMNRILDGCNYLSKAYQKIWNIIKVNGMVFPKARKATSFKEWAEQQL
ncbi:MAG TPA: hypothetical protein VJ912_01485 [Candidatus Nanoarchaeia archaeon]|nr:hypothetical protein [Candidatus Nanoarchaeia archaeon]